MLQRLRSVRFNVILFLIIAGVSAIGTLLPQSGLDADKVAIFQQNHPTWAKIFEQLGFFELYHTIYFAALLGLMAFNVVVCKLAKRPPDTGLAPLPQDQEDTITLRSIQNKPLQLSGTMKDDVAEAERYLAERLRGGRYSIKRTALPSGAVALLATRHRIQRWGSHLSHLSLVVILFGGLLKSLFGFDTMVPVLEGRSGSVLQSVLTKLEEPLKVSSHPVWGRLQAIAAVPSELRKRVQRWSLQSLSQWTVWVDKMIVEFYPSTTVPSTFASNLRLFDGQKPLAEATIRMNQPLDVRGIRFFQASWGVTGMVEQVTLQLGKEKRVIPFKGDFQIPDAPWKGRVEHYLPNFVVGPDGEATTANLEWKNPYLVIGLYNKRNIQIAQMLLPAPAPTTATPDPRSIFMFFEGGNMPINPPLRVLEARPKLFSGVQVSYDPGFPLITAGVLAMLTGLGILFYLHRRSISILIQPGARKNVARVHIGGWSSRGEKEYRQEFTRLFQTLSLES